MNICAARDQGPSSAGMARHLAPFSWRQRMAEIVRRRSWGGVLPLGRHASISGSSLIQYASDSIAHSSFQEEQNARHHNRFKFEQALVLATKRLGPTERSALKFVNLPVTRQWLGGEAGKPEHARRIYA